MVSAAEVELALKQRLEAKDVVSSLVFTRRSLPSHACSDKCCAMQTVVDDSGG